MRKISPILGTIVVFAVMRCGMLMATASEWVGYDEIRSELSQGEHDFSLSGEYRMRYLHLGEFPVDELGTGHGQNNYAAHRLRFSPVIQFGMGFGLFAEFDVVDGLLAGDIATAGQLAAQVSDRKLLQSWLTERGGTRIDSAELRHLFVEWKADFGLLRVGQMGSRWGLGLLANDGTRDRPFSDARYGDIVERFLFVTAPLAALSDDPDAKKFTVALGADLVYQDENAVLLDGDLAFQGVISLNYTFDDANLGIYGAYRHQQDSDGDYLHAWAVDVAGAGIVELVDGVVARIAGEVVAVVGTTDKGRFEGVTGPLDIRSFGGALNMAIVYADAGLDFGVEVGFASGDNHPSDKTLRTFSFDPDHTVGMILFEEALGRLSLRAADRVVDPALSGMPPTGFEAIISNGSVRNALYVNPILQFHPLPGLGMAAGFLWAMSPGEPADAFLTAQHGGYPRNYLGGHGGKNYGYELDVSLEYTVNAWDYFGIRVGTQAGVFFPGSVFEDQAGELFDPVVKVRGVFDIFW